MKEFPVEGDKLKKLVKLARKRSLNFAYNPGTADDGDQFLAIHKRKAPEMLGKIARHDGAGTKAAFGTLTVAGNIMTLMCQRELPTLAKRMKRLMRLNKINLNVQVCDKSGNVIDADIEEMEPGTWFDEADDDDDDDDDDAESADVAGEDVFEAAGNEPGTAPPAPPPPNTAGQAAAVPGADIPPPPPPPPNAAAVDVPPAPPPPPGAAARDLAARLKALQPRVLAAPPVIGDKVTAAFKQAVGLVREGQNDKAAQTLDQIEAVMAKVSVIPPAPPPPPDPRLAKLGEAVAKITQQAQALPEPMAAPLLADLDRINAQLNAGETEAALGALRTIQEALKTAQAAQARWDKAAAVLEPQVNAALSGRTVADPSDLRVKWTYATGLAADGAIDRAIAALPPIVAILKTAAGQGAQAPTPEPAAESAAESAATAAGEPPKGVVAFQKSRILWVGARDQILAEARKLADAITAQASDDEDVDEIKEAGAEIVSEVEKIDERLQDILDDITNAEAGPKREALKRQAAAVVAEYQSMLGSGIFTMIDQNPFAPVSVAARARVALGTIARTLA